MCFGFKIKILGEMVDHLKLVLGGTCLLFAYLYNVYVQYTGNLPAPEVDLTEYWGLEKRINYQEDTSIYPFNISVDSKEIERLKYQLDNIEPLTEPLEGVAFQYGFNSKKLHEIVKYWKSEYLQKWDERESFMNQIPQYSTQIQGLKIHFLHVKPKVDKNVKVLPIMLLHGWPTSFRDFYDMIPLLTASTNENIAFEVIVPSLPGFGFSQGTSKKGLGPDKIAVILRNLMIRLKILKFYVHGGDWVRLYFMTSMSIVL